MANHGTLTTRQREIYEFIRHNIESRSIPPTVRDIGKAFGIKSPNGVMCHLNALVNKGFIERDKNCARSIQLTERRRLSLAELPLLGSVAAGKPIHEQTADERFNFSEMFCGPEHFVLKVRGHSMIDDHIADGDYVVIRKQDTAENGERVVAMIDNEVTLKRFNSSNGKVTLIPCNGTMAPIVVNKDSDSKIVGLLVGVLRKCR